jgi:hypothetical protein
LLSSLAQRAPDLDHNWDLQFAFNWQDVPLFSPKQRDLDNDGVRDNTANSSRYLLGMMLQYGRFGFGTYLRTNTQSWCASGTSCDPSDQVDIKVQHTALAGAMALGRDDLILGAGIYVADVAFDYKGQEWNYTGNGLELDMLYRPLGLPYRVGLSVKPEVVGHYQPSASQLPVVAGRQLYAGVVSPGTISLGTAFRFGEGRENYNRLSPAARKDLGERIGEDWLPPLLPKGTPTGSWLLVLQADYINAAENTVAMNTFTSFSPDVPVGRHGSILPRVGVEDDVLPGRLRLRAGSFLEPSPFPGVLPRPHATGGAEVFLFRYIDSLSLSFAYDLAKNYENFGLALTLWR